MTQDPRPILVGVGPEPVDAALGYAVDLAGRSRQKIHLVHVAHFVPLGPETPLIEVRDVEAIGRQVLRSALEHAHDVASAEQEITSELLVGTVVPALVHAAEGAGAVVLEHRPLGRLQRVVTRSVASGVAARTDVPVVSVPSGWQADLTGVWVSVGVDDPARSGVVLRAALEEARSRGAGLRVVHAMDCPGVYRDALLSSSQLAEWQDRATRGLRERLAVLLQEEGEVRVDVVADWSSAAEALVHASHDSALVVLGRHDPWLPRGSHLGPVARAVLRDAVCPVLLANPQPTGRRDVD